MESWEPSEHLLIDTGKPRKPCVEMAGRSPASKVKKKQCPHSTTNTRKMTTYTRQLQQYARSTNNSYTKDILKLAKNARDK